MTADAGREGFVPNGEPPEAVLAQMRTLREDPGDLLDRLSSYVSYEIGRRITMGQLNVSDLQRDEVIDNAFASALARLEEGAPIRNLNNYLRSRAQDMIRREVRRVSNERLRIVSLDQIVYSEGEDGEQVTLADVIPDNESRLLDEAAVDAETLSYLIESLSGLPDRWRTIFLQRTIYGRNAYSIAEEHEILVDEVRRIVVRSRDYLRDQMENTHFAMDEDDF